MSISFENLDISLSPPTYRCRVNEPIARKRQANKDGEVSIRRWGCGDGRRSLSFYRCRV